MIILIVKAIIIIIVITNAIWKHGRRPSVTVLANTIIMRLIIVNALVMVIDDTIDDTT